MTETTDETSTSQAVGPEGTNTAALVREAELTFELGNYALARKQAQAVEELGVGPDRDRATALLARMAPAPLGKYLLLLTGLLLVMVTVFAYSR